MGIKNIPKVSVLFKTRYSNEDCLKKYIYQLAGLRVAEIVQTHIKIPHELIIVTTVCNSRCLFTKTGQISIINYKIIEVRDL